MHSKFKKEHMVDVLFPLALLLVFAASAVMVLLLAANVYREISGDAAMTDTSRTVTAYLSEKVRQNDAAGAITLDTFGEGDALVLEQTGETGQVFCTRIYLWDGTLRELMVPEGVEMDPDRGKIIVSLQDFQAEYLEKDLLYFSCTDRNGNTASVCAALRSAGE